MYRYYTLYRPPMMGGIPKMGLKMVHCFNTRIEVCEIGKQAWGYAVYDRPLTEAEIGEYELAPDPRNLNY